MAFGAEVVTQRSEVEVNVRRKHLDGARPLNRYERTASMPILERDSEHRKVLVEELPHLVGVPGIDDE